jgi:hypothetical protein
VTLWRHFLVAVLLLTNVGACIKIGTRSGELERAHWRLVTAAPLTSLNTNLINVVTLGHRGLFDDFATIWTIQFIADNKLTSKSNADDVYKAVSAVTQHHPRTEILYIISCFTLAFDFKRFDLCESISRDGLVALPKSFRIPMMQGFVSMYLLHDNLKAAAFYQMAASHPESPAYIGHLAGKLAKKGTLDGQDLNETVELFRNIPGGTKIIDIMRERLKNQEPAPSTGGLP